MSNQVKKRKTGRVLAIKVLKLTWKTSLLILCGILDIASEKRPKPLPVISAQILHDDDLISDEEYMRSVFSEE